MKKKNIFDIKNYLDFKKNFLDKQKDKNIIEYDKEIEKINDIKTEIKIPKIIFQIDNNSIFYNWRNKIYYKR